MGEPAPRFKRILLKLSGEALMGDTGFGIDPDVIERIASEIAEVRALGVEIAIVIGGGNIFRGVAASAHGMDRATADYMGMLATVMNALALQDALERVNVTTRVLSAIEMQELVRAVHPPPRHAPPREGARRHLRAPAPAIPTSRPTPPPRLRAMEIHADVLLKATKVDGIYDKDPIKHPDAQRFHRLTYLEVLQQNLKVMDSTAIALCRDNKLAIVVFDLHTRGNIRARRRAASRSARWSQTRRTVHGERHRQGPRGRRRQGPRFAQARARQGAHRPREPRAARRRPRRLLRHADAAQSGRVAVDARRAPHHDQAVGEEADPRDRKGDPQGRARRQPEQRR